VLYNTEKFVGTGSVSGGHHDDDRSGIGKSRFDGTLTFGTELCNSGSRFDLFTTSFLCPMKTNFLLSTFLACVLLVVLAETGAAQTDLDVKSIRNERLREILTLPSGLSVTHSPNPVSAMLSSNLTFRYIWPYTTTVTPKIEGLTVIEFGGFLFREGAWQFANDTGKAFGPKEFREWYATPADGVLLPGKKYPDPTNRTMASKLVGQQGLWYFIAQGKDGKKYQGYSVVKCVPVLKKAEVPSSPPTTSSGNKSK